MITGSYVLERVSMFARLARLVINYPKSMLASALVVLAIAIASMALITPNLSTDFELGDSAESQAARHGDRREEWSSLPKVKVGPPLLIWAALDGWRGALASAS